MVKVVDEGRPVMLSDDIDETLVQMMLQREDPDAIPFEDPTLANLPS